MDTPGFSSIDMERAQRIYKHELASYFREFARYSENCRFTGCSHTKESGCAVINAVQNGDIMPERYESYNIIYNEIKDLKAWK